MTKQARDIPLQEATKKSRVLLVEALESFRQELKRRRFFGDYFCREAKEDARICCPKGWFSCEGAFNEENCSKPHHRINPYSSKESRVLFSTWNFDHV